MENSACLAKSRLVYACLLSRWLSSASYPLLQKYDQITVVDTGNQHSTCETLMIFSVIERHTPESETSLCSSGPIAETGYGINDFYNSYKRQP
ncbi:hypothetical protein [Klebsiella sp. BIGb0407]|uniref:hypothetical protein n=1 Tax=Klebsiella sp. BIGb0407 TaxID=2940603 RepID=UPI002167D705|nr:hypothetical protein [Klebsiella sp. BIGb0407]MCS3429621.1 hypothetical protein [Klebsiella sp. BIGb0407]